MDCPLALAFTAVTADLAADGEGLLAAFHRRTS